MTAMAAAFVAIQIALAAAQTPDEIVARNLEARGGLARLQAVRSVRMIGRAPAGAQARSLMDDARAGVAVIVLEAKRPNLVRNTWMAWGLTDAQYRMVLGDVAKGTKADNPVRRALLGAAAGTDLLRPGLSIVNATDGRTAWSFNSEQRQVISTAVGDSAPGFPLDGMLHDYRRKGHEVEPAGRAEVEGKRCLALTLRTKQGDAYTIYLDEATYLEAVVEAKTRRSPFIVRTTYGDWKPVGGVMIPHTTVTSGAAGPGQTVTIDQVELNVPMDDGRFSPPPVKD